MINGKRVVAWTPYGREVTASILAEYMRRDHERGVVDEWWLCLNTDPDQVSDLRYAYKLVQQSGSHADRWIKAMDRPPGLPFRTPKQRNTGTFYRYMTDPDSVFVRFDDDIIYVHDDAVERLVRAKQEMRPTMCCHALMWNNSITSWFLQQAGIIPREFGVVNSMYCMDPMGWANGEFAVKIHRLLLDTVRAGEAEKLYLYQDMPLKLGQQFSVSCFSSLGEDYANLPEPGVLVPDEEEHWHTVHRPQEIGAPNIVVGNALVSHYTFFPQRAIVLGTDVLDQYRALAGTL